MWYGYFCTGASKIINNYSWNEKCSLSCINENKSFFEWHMYGMLESFEYFKLEGQQTF
jgi:hypothetical protein